MLEAIYDGHTYSNGETERTVTCIYEYMSGNPKVDWVETYVCSGCKNRIKTKKNNTCLESTFKKWAKTEISGHMIKPSKGNAALRYNTPIAEGSNT
jgi:hypothetical protein